MPYKKTVRRKRYGKKKAWYSKKYSALQIAKQAWKAAKYVKSLVNVEYKYFDVLNTSLSPSTTGAIYPLTQIADGDTYNTRDGNSIKAVSIFQRMSYQLNSSSDATFLRYILFMDNENQGSTPALTDVLESLGYLSPLNHVNGTRFTVIRDKVLVLDKTFNAKQMKVFVKCNNHIKWSGTNATDMKEGHIFMLLLSDEATNFPIVNVLSRLRFIDN